MKSRVELVVVTRALSSVALQMHNKLLELLDTNGIHRETESFSTHPRSALRHLKVNTSIPAPRCESFKANYTVSGKNVPQ